ncbi:hypothetical protein KAH94_06335 [bacterium]|nr:hypothetical protein [bacterium]
MPKKMFVGIDSSGEKGFDPAGFGYFVLTAVTCTDLGKATKAIQDIEKKIAKGHEKYLYNSWMQLAKILTDYDFRYYVLLVDKSYTPKWFSKNYPTIKFPQATKKNKYSAIFDQFAKHGWLIPEIWRKQHGKFPSEIRIDNEMTGKGWELFKKKVKVHAENHIGPCDIADAKEEEYPLVKIAHFVSNITYCQMREGSLIEHQPKILWILAPLTRIFNLVTIPDFEMFSFDNPLFTPW